GAAFPTISATIHYDQELLDGTISTSGPAHFEFSTPNVQITDVALDAFGVLVASGKINFQQGDVTDPAVGGTAHALVFTVTDGQVFAGVGGSLSGSTVVTDGATGVYGTIGKLTFVSITQGAQSWFAVDAAGLNASLVGVPGMTLAISDGVLQVNHAGGGASKLDWTTFAPSGMSLPQLQVGAATDLHISATVTVDAF